MPGTMTSRQFAGSAAQPGWPLPEASTKQWTVNTTTGLLRQACQADETGQCLIVHAAQLLCACQRQYVLIMPLFASFSAFARFFCQHDKPKCKSRCLAPASSIPFHESQHVSSMIPILYYRCAACFSVHLQFAVLSKDPGIGSGHAWPPQALPHDSIMRLTLNMYEPW